MIQGVLSLLYRKEDAGLEKMVCTGYRSASVDRLEVYKITGRVDRDRTRLI